LKDLVVGAAMHSPALARRSAAYAACVQLHKIGELDDNLMPLGKESVLPAVKVEDEPPLPIDGQLDECMRPGTTKRRQYYYKRVAPCLTSNGLDKTAANNKSPPSQSSSETERNAETSDQYHVCESSQPPFTSANSPTTNVITTEPVTLELPASIPSTCQQVCHRLCERTETLTTISSPGICQTSSKHLSNHRMEHHKSHTEQSDSIRTEKDMSNLSCGTGDSCDTTKDNADKISKSPNLSIKSNTECLSCSLDLPTTEGDNVADEIIPSSSECVLSECETSQKDGGDSEEAEYDPIELLMLPALNKKFPNIKYYQTKLDPVLRDRFNKIRLPDQFTNSSISNPTTSTPSTSSYHLYAMRMTLTCPIPDEQNTRGRRIHDPAHADQLFGLLLPRAMPPIPAFPIYTRSGEVLVTLSLVEAELSLTPDQLALIYTYHVFTFYSVLRLEKYPMVFNCEEEHNSVVVLPLIRSKHKSADGATKPNESTEKPIIDWEFLQVVKYLSTKRLRSLDETERQEFAFDASAYRDAVIMPWYRNQDQPQYFYVAEVCAHLNPSSDFPGQGFETFAKYYGTKYGIHIQNLGQPLLDVDHTSARLNFLTPRYVNRKGIALPTSSEETKRQKRENLDQKQILVPELCAIHPFPASLWRQTVALPCTMYRLNGLLIADQIRHTVALDMRLGVAELATTGHTWEPLHFGWTLADVVKNSRAAAKGAANDAKPATQTSSGSESGEATSSGNKLENSDRSGRKNSKGDSDMDDEEEDSTEGTGLWDEADMGKMEAKLLHKLAMEERRAKKKKMEIGTWNNDMANQGSPNWDELDDEDDEDMELAGVALPDNLTFLSSSSTIKTGKVKKSANEMEDLTYDEDDDGVEEIGRGNRTHTSTTSDNIKSSTAVAPSDWGTGIQSKNFRVGSPTCFGTTGGASHMSGLMDDLEGFSCSDSEYDDWPDDRSYTSDYDYDGGNGRSGGRGDQRIEFHGDNLAETIEEEATTAAREERHAKDRDQEASMVENEAWDPNKLLSDSTTNNDNNADLLGGTGEEPVLTGVQVCPVESFAKLLKLSDLSSSAESTSKIVPDIPNYTPDTPDLAEHRADLDNVLTSLSLAPDLSLVRPLNNDSGDELQHGVIPWPDVDQPASFLVGFDHQPQLDGHPGPSPSLILQALTMSNSNDAINLERLETIGDSFLKYAITSYLYIEHPNIHEGKLSHLRSKQVSNLNLYQLGRKRGLGECMIATKFEPHDNWLPPCYHVPRELEKALIESGVPSSHWNMADLPGVDKMSSEQICSLLRERCARNLDTEENIQDIPSFIPYNLLTQHSIPDKSIADCVEALIGAYLISCGPRGALLLMTWLGIKVLPGSMSEPGRLLPPASPLLRSPWTPDPDRQLAYLLDGYTKFEHMIGYVWRDKSYLLQAFSHASYYPNRLTDCYQRLEFLGDAVLDYLITRHLYQDNRLHSPGALTDLRSALVNNTIFACLAVRHQFHKFFKHLSPGMQVVCDRFVRIQAENNWKVSEDCYLMEEDENEEAEDIEVPKALGDIFESVAGSIYLDSGLSLDAVWTVYFRMMKDEIEQFSSHVPKSPIRELLELEPETAKFGKPEKLADGRRVRVSVEVFGKGVFKGIGRNYRIAKCTAAKCALKALRRMEARSKKKTTNA